VSQHLPVAGLTQTNPRGRRARQPCEPETQGSTPARTIAAVDHGQPISGRPGRRLACL